MRTLIAFLTFAALLAPSAHAQWADPGGTRSTTTTTLGAVPSPAEPSASLVATATPDEPAATADAITAARPPVPDPPAPVARPAVPDPPAPSPRPSVPCGFATACRADVPDVPTWAQNLPRPPFCNPFRGLCPA